MRKDKGTGSHTFFAPRVKTKKLRPEYRYELDSLKAFADHKITDSEKNPIALHKDDFSKFIQYIETNFGEKDIRKLSRDQLVQAISKAEVRLIKAFSPENLEKQVLDIDYFNKNHDVKTTAGIPAQKDSKPHCITMLSNGQIYMAPKIVPIAVEHSLQSDGEFILTLAPEKIGTAHSSGALSHYDGDVIFAGSMAFNPSLNAWSLDNTTGHYHTTVEDLVEFLDKLAKNGLDLAALYVKTWTPKDPENPGSAEKDFHTAFENAAKFLEQNLQKDSDVSSSRSFSP